MTPLFTIVVRSTIPILRIVGLPTILILRVGRLTILCRIVSLSFLVYNRWPSNNPSFTIIDLSTTPFRQDRSPFNDPIFYDRWPCNDSIFT